MLGAERGPIGDALDFGDLEDEVVLDHFGDARPLDGGPQRTDQPGHPLSRVRQEGLMAPQSYAQGRDVVRRMAEGNAIAQRDGAEIVEDDLDGRSEGERGDGGVPEVLGKPERRGAVL